MIVDAKGKPIYSGNITHDDVVAAIQAAALADEFETAEEIADRHGLTSICLNCALKSATTAHEDSQAAQRRVCITCFHQLESRRPPSFASVRSFVQGLVKRDVQ